MAFTDAISRLNRLKQRHVLRDYVVIGAVAATAYMEPVFTEDIDIIVLVDTDEEYLQTFRPIIEQAEGVEGMHHIIGGVPVQVFPSTVMPLYRDAVENGRKVRIGTTRAKVATAEHLVLLYLLSNRQRDRIRIRYLLDGGIDEEWLNSLLGRFDDAEQTLAARLAELRGPSVPREGEMAPAPGQDEP